MDCEIATVAGHRVVAGAVDREVLPRRCLRCGSDPLSPEVIAAFGRRALLIESHEPYARLCAKRLRAVEGNIDRAEAA